MSRIVFIRNLFFAFVLITALGFLSASPAFANTLQGGGGQICTGKNYTLSTGQSTDSLLAFGCNVTIEQGATIRGDLADFGGNVSIGGTIGGNIITFGGNISLAESAVINGAINSIGGNIQREAGATIGGGVNTNPGSVPPVPVAPPAPVPLSPFARLFNFGFNVLGGIVTAIAFAALGALVVIFAPEPTRRVGNAVEAKPLNVAGVGCLTLIFIPILAILLAITIIGIPVVILLGIAAFIAWVFGWIALGYLTGEKILQAFKTRDVLPVVAVILGVLILTLLSQVSILGWLVSLIGGLLGIGAVVLTRFGTRPYPPVPSMMLTPAVATAASSVPGTYTPTSVDVAAWEEKARQAQTAEPSPPAATTPPSEILPTETQSETPPNDSESKPNT